MATCLAFYPWDNNIVALGMDNSSILIYNVRTNKVYLFLHLRKICIIACYKEAEASFLFLSLVQVLSKLKGHSKRVTALAFSSNFNILVSGDINAQVSI